MSTDDFRRPAPQNVRPANDIPAVEQEERGGGEAAGGRGPQKKREHTSQFRYDTNK